MIDWLRQKIFTRYLGSAIRTLLTALSTYLVSIGLDSEVVSAWAQSAEAVWLGIATLIATQLWSWYDKSKTKKKDK